MIQKILLQRPALRGAAVILATAIQAAEAPAGWQSPNSVVASPDRTRAFLGAATANAVLVVDVAARNVDRKLPLPASPQALCLSPDGSRLLVAAGGSNGMVCVLDTDSGELLQHFHTGHTPTDLVCFDDGVRVAVPNRFDANVAVWDLATGRELLRVPVPREPISIALAPDQKTLFVAHHLPEGKASANRVAANVTIVDLEAGRIAGTLLLPNGSTTLRQIRLSPDGKLAAVVHTLARYQLPTTQLERGWMNTSAVTLIDVAARQIINSVLLDEVDYGAANPWGIAWTADSRRLLITHAGTHELSVIEVPDLLDRLAKLPATRPEGVTPQYISASATQADVPNDLAFLVGYRERIRLSGNGPRAVAMFGETAVVADYFSDTLELVDLTRSPRRPESFLLGPIPVRTPERWGEQLFNDATICFQQWQSCASCHSEDARIDGLNWDLMNDGLGNPKNSKSLVLSHQTPPAMSLGVRDDARAAVRAGIRHILFAVRPAEEAEALDVWLAGLRPIPSPHLIDGDPSPSATRGREIFQDELVGCAGCHPGPRFTDGLAYDVGTAGEFDREVKEFDTPTLVEIWRTAPYLHDGSAATLREVLVDRNLTDAHGRVSDLAPTELADLIEYLNSL
ncbi:MAG: cell surface protein [Verrucomicrobiales bacterium]|nr:cell surface protein [Verrucomicrobiales bacterium]MCP5528527.1 cell surface protein [Verrucomicrobiales bacterium]